MPAGIANGSSIVEPERSQIIVRLAHGESVRSISNSLGHHWHTVNAVKEAEWSRIEQRKPIITAQHERAATTALDIINDKLKAGVPDDFSLTELNVIAGTSTDKAVLLRGDAASTIRHIHSFDLTDDDIVAFAVSRSKSAAANAAAIEAEITPAPALTSAPAPETAAHPALDLPAQLPAGFIAPAKAKPVKAKRQRKTKG